MENVCRRLIILELAVARNPAAPDFSGLDVVNESPLGSQGQAYVSTITTWVTDRLKERAQIQKQARLFREEFGRGKGGVKEAWKGEDGDADGAKWRRKKKKDVSGGAGGSAAAS